MQRVISSFLLIFWLAVIVAPVALAISASAPHACCLRSQHSHGAPNSFHASPACCQHHCCAPLTVPHWAKIAEIGGSDCPIKACSLKSQVETGNLLHHSEKFRPVRAPPFEG